MSVRTNDASSGAAWLSSDPDAAGMLTPERLSDEHRLIGRTAADFVAGEVLPALDDLERKNWDRARALLVRAGDLGLLGVDVPEPLGGVALDIAASVVVTDALGACAAFSTTFGAQTGLTIMPILGFGTDAQQRTYLPRLVTGEIVGAYCLSESASGSDALGARARAARQADGSWILNGEKLWITNGGFADLFVVFAKVDGEHFSAFLVERGFPGVTAGKEEHKMGLHGSSTTPVVLSEARVPAGNLLGEVGRGHIIAFNVLNYGRLKLAAMCTGGARRVVREAAAYAMSRRQFDRPIGTFGAIRQKLADMTVRLFAAESGLFRIAGLIDARLNGSHEAGALPRALEEYAIETSLLKVAASEMLDDVADENVQIHGGNGFVRDYPAERHFRDQRVNRIFEGTNEINRLLVPAMLVKRARKGLIAVLDEPAAIERSSPEAHAVGAGSPLAVSRRTVSGLKQSALALVRLAVRCYGDRWAEEQETAMLASDVIRDAFLAEGALLRAEQMAADGHPLASAAADAATIFVHDAGWRAMTAGRVAIAAMTSGDARDRHLEQLAQLLAPAPVDTIGARRRLADEVIERKRYPFDFC